MATVNIGNIKFTWQGAYNGSTAYAVDDIVSYNGSSYVCILASTGNLPTDTTYWNVMAQGGTDITSITGLAQGDILYYNGTDWVRLGAGTSGYYLKTQGASANPVWSAVSSDFVHIKTIDASNVASVELVDGSNDIVFDGTYERYHLKIMNYYSNGTASELQFRVTTDGGSTYKTSGYNTVRFRSYYSGVTSATSVMTDAIARFHFGPIASGTSNQSLSFGDLWFSKPTLSHYPDCTGFFWGAENDQALAGYVRGRWQTTTSAWDGIKIEQQGGGNFSAKLAWYGIKA